MQQQRTGRPWEWPVELTAAEAAAARIAAMVGGPGPAAVLAGRQPARPELPRGRTRLEGRPRTACLLDRSQAQVAVELAARIGIGKAAEELGVSRNTLTNTWRRYGITLARPAA